MRSDGSTSEIRSTPRLNFRGRISWASHPPNFVRARPAAPRHSLAGVVPLEIEDRGKQSFLCSFSRARGDVCETHLGAVSAAGLLWQGLEASAIMDLRNRYREHCRKEGLRFKRRTGRWFCKRGVPSPRNRPKLCRSSAKGIGRRFTPFFVTAVTLLPKRRILSKVSLPICLNKIR